MNKKSKPKPNYATKEDLNKLLIEIEILRSNMVRLEEKLKC